MRTLAILMTVCVLTTVTALDVCPASLYDALPPPSPASVNLAWSPSAARPQPALNDTILFVPAATTVQVYVAFPPFGSTDTAPVATFTAAVTSLAALDTAFGFAALTSDGRAWIATPTLAPGPPLAVDVAELAIAAPTATHIAVVDTGPNTAVAVALSAPPMIAVFSPLDAVLAPAATLVLDIAPGLESVAALAIGDINDDGALDLVFSTITATMGGIVYTASGIPGPVLAFPPTPEPIPDGLTTSGLWVVIRIADANDDGFNDIAFVRGASHSTPATVGVLFSAPLRSTHLGAQTVTFPSAPIPSIGRHNVTIADINGDGSLDFVHITMGGEVYFIPTTDVGFVTTISGTLEAQHVGSVPAVDAIPIVVGTKLFGISTSATVVVDMEYGSAFTGFVASGIPTTITTTGRPLIGNILNNADANFLVVDSENPGFVAFFRYNFQLGTSVHIGSADFASPCRAFSIVRMTDSQYSNVVCVSGADLFTATVQDNALTLSHSDFVTTGSIDGIVTVADANGDGSSDLVLSCSTPCVDGVSLILGYVDRSAADLMSFDILLSHVSVSGLSYVDVTGDGLPDLLFADDKAVTAVVANPSLSPPYEPIPVSLASVATSVLVDYVLADVNGDGFSDVVTITPWELAVYAGNGGGSFGPGADVVATSSGTFAAVAAASLANRGLADIFVSTNTSSQVVRWTLRPAGWASISINVGYVPTAIVVSHDFDGDGFLDMLVMSDGNPAVLYRSRPLPAWRPHTATSFSPSLPPSVFNAGLLFDLHSWCWTTTLTMAPGDVIPACGMGTLGPGGMALTVPPLARWKMVGSGSGSPDVDCSSTGGGVFVDIRENAVLRLDSMKLHGGTYGYSNLATNMVRVGSQGFLFAMDSEFTACSTVGANPVLQLNSGLGGPIGVDAGFALFRNAVFSGNTAQAGGGAIALTGGTATVAAIDTLFAGNTAFGASSDLGVGGGGAVLVQGASSFFGCRRCTFADNGASRGVGGAILVREYAADAIVTLEGGSATGNDGGVAGGVMAVVGTRAVVQVTGALVFGAGNTAEVGGVVAAVHPNYLFPAPTTEGALMSLDYPPGDGAWVSLALSALPSVTMAPDVTVTGSSATYGGVAFACGGVVNASGVAVSGVEAVDGNFGFLCLDSQTRTATRREWIAGTGVVSTPPVAPVIEPGSVPPSVPAGVGLGSGTAVAVNAFGGPIADSSLVLQLTKVTTDVALSNIELGAPGVPASDGSVSYSFGLATVYPPLAWLQAANGAASGRPATFGVLFSGSAASTPFTPFTVNVTECPPGFGISSEAVGVVACTACSEGSVSDDTSLAPCTAVPECGTGAIRVVETNGTSGAAPCVCARGSWARSLIGGGSTLGAGEACVPCPRGGVCEGGVALPVAAPGFWPQGERGAGAYTFIACKRQKACAGRGRCNSGYEGYMCNVCSDGYYSDGAAACVRCPSGSTGLTATVLVIVALGGIVVGVALGQKAATTKDETLRARRVPASITMVIVAGQTVSILLQTKLGWSDSARKVFGFTQVLVLDTSLFASECALASWHVKWSVSMLLVGVLGLAVLCGVGVFKAVRGLELSVGAMVDLVFSSLAAVLYLPLARTTLILFDCTRLPNGNVVLDVDPSVACFDSAWWSVAPLGLVGAGGVVAMPAYFLWRLVSASRAGELATRRVFLRYGPLYRLYKTAFFWGEIAQMGKRFVFVAFSLFLSNAPLVQLMALLVLLAGSAVVMERTYFFPLYSQLEQQLGLVVVAVLLLGVASYAERGTETVDNGWFVAVAVLELAALVLVAIRGIVLDVGQIRREAAGAYSACDERRNDLQRLVARESLDWDGAGGVASSESAAAVEMVVV